jgi:hypothetical protein
MPRDIAVICASPPGFNAGMYSVDLGFRLLAQKYGFLDRVQAYQLYPAGNPVAAGMENPYLTIPSDDDFFRSQQAIIFWGDFLHMHQYHKAVAKKLLDNNLVTNAGMARQRAREVFLLQGQGDDVLEKSLSFGSTLLFNTMQDELEPDYRIPLERFLKRSRSVWFRDIYSAIKACHIRETYQLNCLGVDCANLIDPTLLSSLGGKPKMDGFVGLFFGRTTANTKEMLDFALELTKNLGCKPAWLNWGDTSAFPTLTSIYKLRSIRSMDFFTEKTVSQPMDAIQALLKYKVIITDTYHVCVNAWNLGIPAICLVENEFSLRRNVNFGDSFSPRDKRQVFMGMYDALNFLVSGDHLKKEHRKARIEHLIDLIHSGNEIEAIYNRIRLHAASAEHSLIQDIQKFL